MKTTGNNLGSTYFKLNLRCLCCKARSQSDSRGVQNERQLYDAKFRRMSLAYIICH